MDPVAVDQRGAMNAEEARGVEAALEFDDGLIDDVPMSIDDGLSELVVSYKMSDGLDVKKRDALTDARGDATRIVGLLAAQRSSELLEKQAWVALPVGLGDGAQAAEFFEGAGQLRGFYRFNKIVNGVDLEGAECVFVVGGGEDHEGLHGEARKQIEAVDAGHLNVEEEHVDGGGGLRVEIGESLRGVGRSGDDLKIVEAGEQALEPLNGERFIVDEIGAEWSGFHSQFHCARFLCGKRHANHGLFVFARDGKLAGLAEEQFKTRDEIAQAVLGRDGFE